MPTEPLGQFSISRTKHRAVTKQSVAAKAALVVVQTAAANRSTVTTASGNDAGSRLILRCRLGDATMRLLTIAAGTVPLLSAEIVWAQNGSMMNGDMWGGGWLGGFGGIWGLALLVIVIAAVVAWAVRRK
jgi:hypothetical protein